MKKYFLGVTAILIAIAFSAFTKPNTLELYLLNNDPVTSGIAEDPNEWSTGNFGGYAACDINPQDVACEIELNNSTMSSYTHTVNGDKVINSQAYATAGGAHLDYVIITVTIGQNPHRIIVTIRFMHWDPVLGVYVDVTATLTIGIDYKFKNARL
jgi:hypothetical protein